MEQQEKFVLEYYKYATNLFYVEVGANDGVTISNTVHLEKDYGWNGICIEPIYECYEKLVKNRKAKCYNLCAYSANTDIVFCKIQGYSEMLSGIDSCYDIRHKNRINAEVKERNQKQEYLTLPAKTLQSILEENFVNQIDYLSIDTEGSELEVLKGIDFAKTKIGLLSLEDNYNDRHADDILLKNGYKYMDRICLDNFYISDQI